MKHLKRYWHLAVALILILYLCVRFDAVKEACSNAEAWAAVLLTFTVLWAFICIALECVVLDEKTWGERVNRAYHQGVEDVKKEQDGSNTQR